MYCKIKFDLDEEFEIFNFNYPEDIPENIVYLKLYYLTVEEFIGDFGDVKNR